MSPLLLWFAVGLSLDLCLGLVVLAALQMSREMDRYATLRDPDEDEVTEHLAAGKSTLNLGDA